MRDPSPRNGRNAGRYSQIRTPGSSRWQTHPEKSPKKMYRTKRYTQKTVQVQVENTLQAGRNGDPGSTAGTVVNGRQAAVHLQVCTQVIYRNGTQWCNAETAGSICRHPMVAGKSGTPGEIQQVHPAGTRYPQAGAGRKSMASPAPRTNAGVNGGRNGAEPERWHPVQAGRRTVTCRR